MKTPSSPLAVFACLALVLAGVPNVFGFLTDTKHHAQVASKYSTFQSQNEPPPVTTSPRTPPATPTTTATIPPPKTAYPTPTPTRDRPFDPRDLSVDDRLYANGFERALGMANSTKQQPATAKDPKLTIGKVTKPSKDTNATYQSDGKHTVGQTQIKQKHGPTPKKHVDPKKAGKTN